MQMYTHISVGLHRHSRKKQRNKKSPDEHVTEHHTYEHTLII